MTAEAKRKKRAKKRSAPTRKPGAQPGNKNALRHGFYSKRFTTDESKRLNETQEIDVQGEIALLRVCIDRLTQQLDFSRNMIVDMQGNKTRDDHYLKALNTLAIMAGAVSTLARTHYLINGQSGDVAEALERAWEKIREDFES